MTTKIKTTKKLKGKRYTAREIIKKEYGSAKNFMTPNIISYGKINKNIAYELAHGKGFNSDSDSDIYGVSVAEIDNKGNTKRRYILSSSFDTLSQAKGHIAFLKNKYA